MNDINISGLYLMPKIDPVYFQDVLSQEQITPVLDALDHIDGMYDQVKQISKLQTVIYRHGSSEAVLEDYTDLLDHYHINFKTQSIQACTEGLSSVISRIWEAIKNIISRIMDYLQNNEYFAQWFNGCERCRVKMASYISGCLRDYAKVDATKFEKNMFRIMPYPVFTQYLNALSMLILKLKNCMSLNLSMIDVTTVFKDCLASLKIVCENGKIFANFPFYDLKSAKALYWNPSKIYYVANDLYSKVAINSMELMRIQKTIERVVGETYRECNDVLSGRIDGNDEKKIMEARQRIRNIRNLNELIRITIRLTYMMCKQWLTLVGKMDFGVYPEPNV